jgi:hypothetical protein
VRDEQQALAGDKTEFLKYPGLLNWSLGTRDSNSSIDYKRSDSSVFYPYKNINKLIIGLLLILMLHIDQLLF